MDGSHATLQQQLNRFRTYFRDQSGHLELLAESADPLLRRMAAYVLMDLTLERRVVILSDEQFEQLTAGFGEPFRQGLSDTSMCVN